MNLSQRIFQDRRFVAVYERLRESSLSALLLGRTIAGEIDDVVRAVDRGVAETGVDRVLDIACGQATFTAGLSRLRPSLRITGLDISLAQIERARARSVPSASFVVGDATRLEFEQAVFGAVICMGGLHQIPDQAGVAREVARVSAPGATFSGAFFSRPGPAGALRAAFEAATGMTFVDPLAWGRILTDAGFREYRFERRTSVWGVFEAVRATG